MSISQLFTLFTLWPINATSLMSAPASKMFRFQVQVPNVYAYMMDTDPICRVGTLFSDYNEVSGWVKEENIEYAKQKFAGYPIRFIPSDFYWKFYDEVGTCREYGSKQFEPGVTFLPVTSEI